MANVEWLDPDVDEPLEDGHVETMEEVRWKSRRLCDVVPSEKLFEVVGDMIAAAPKLKHAFFYPRSHTGMTYQLLSIPNHCKFVTLTVSGPRGKKKKFNIKP